jgi:Tol biopolymer transport system component
VFGGVDGTLLAAAFDLTKLEIIGPVVQILEDLQVFDRGAANFSLSNNGDLAYLTGPSTSVMTLVTLSGIELHSSSRKDFSAPRFSPDGNKAAVAVDGDGIRDIYIYTFGDGSFSRLTFTGINGYPIWTPDGQRVAFYSYRAGTFDFYWKKADGTSDAEPILTSEFELREISFSSDGKSIVYRKMDPDTGPDLWFSSIGIGSEPEPYLVTPFSEMMPALSPDDHFVAYVSNETGINEVYVRTFPDPQGGIWQISEGGGREPLWSKDGRKLFYRTGAEIISVDVETDPVFKKGKSEALFKDIYIWGIRHQNYDVHPESEQFLMLKNLYSRGITLVINWTEELKRLAPKN